MEGVPGRPQVAPPLITYLPVRHHSPACARHVGRVIRSQRPELVLIEGPRDAQPLLGWLTHPETVAPVALYSFVNDPDWRAAAYYPLADHSPELEALRAAREVGAEARFIDLSLAEMRMVERVERPARVRSLLEETWMSESQRLKAAARALGRRDSDELWDHLFEARETDSRTFFEGVLEYCALARQDYTPELLEAEGHAAREGVMAAAVAAASGRSTVVVTGGFHTVALPTTAPGPAPHPRTAGEVVLIRYSFPRLDRLNGYASGMPGPEFSQRAWEGEDPDRLLAEVARALRGRGISTADLLEADRQMRALAAMRGHHRPAREDLLDAVRSVFIQGADDVEGVAVLAEARRCLCGARVGRLPPGVARTPLVEDFEARARALKLPLESLGERELFLELYRRPSHRRISRLLHRLRFLGVPYAFWRKAGSEQLRESWWVAWEPATEARLVEQSVYGAGLEEACSGLLLELLEALPERSCQQAAGLVVEACRMGLHRQTARLLPETARRVADDGDFVSVVGACLRLEELTWRAPLEADRLIGLTELRQAAAQRAGFLLPGLAATPPESESAVLDALKALPDSVLRLDGLESLADSQGSGCMRGAAWGLLLAAGRRSAPELGQHARGELLGEGGAGFLRGLLAMSRSALWQVEGLVEAMSERLASFAEDDFLARLPHWRLAFAELTPRETDRLARELKRLTGAELALERPLRASGEDLARARQLEQAVAERLAMEGL